ncbi:hypothetical protein [Colwellia sp. UCD-KL20]|uniref:hypothetical protein n=1 Tax=Colwellia sp. UCD-KL20 TaxID=1917165 RepID=UPI0011783790|nr:hypothetical protein [Colwellia sp. UCD-KL20]
MLGTLLSGCFTDNTPNRTLPNAPLDAKRYPITFTHKGEQAGKTLSNTLYQLVVEDKNDARYFMDVASVFCGENVCKIDKVRLFWNELGFYDHIELAEGVKLEKGEALDFEPEDYLKLDKVLSNTESGLKLLEKHELVSKKSGGNGVDALTGATVSLHKNDYITGAIWTCYTLWHFANGDMHHIIRNFTGDGYSLEKLHQLLLTGDREYQQFVLEQLIRRKAVDDKTRELVVGLALNNQVKIVDSSLLTVSKIPQLYVNYIEQLPEEYYVWAIQKFIRGNNSQLRWLALKSLELTSKPLPHKMLLTISENLSKFDSYQQVNLFLTILKLQHKPQQKVAVNTNQNNDINQQLVKLLDHENFIIARAIFWALNEQKVTSGIKQKLTNFEQEYGYKL